MALGDAVMKSDLFLDVCPPSEPRPRGGGDIDVGVDVEVDGGVSGERDAAYFSQMCRFVGVLLLFIFIIS